MGAAPLGLVFLIGAGFCFFFSVLWWPVVAPHSSKLIGLGLLFCVISKFFGGGL